VSKPAAAVALKLAKGKATITVKAGGKAATGKVALMINSRTVRTLTLKKGKATATLPRLKAGTYKVSASYLGATATRTLKVK
jgi:hypothetical protein